MEKETPQNTSELSLSMIEGIQNTLILLAHPYPRRDSSTARAFKVNLKSSRENIY